MLYNQDTNIVNDLTCL